MVSGSRQIEELRVQSYVHVYFAHCMCLYIFLHLFVRRLCLISCYGSCAIEIPIIIMSLQSACLWLHENICLNKLYSLHSHSANVCLACSEFMLPVVRLGGTSAARGTFAATKSTSHHQNYLSFLQLPSFSASLQLQKQRPRCLCKVGFAAARLVFAYLQFWRRQN